MAKKKRVYHELRESSPQLVLATLIFKEGSWGAYDSKSSAATRAEVERFFDKVIAICAAESSFNAQAVNGVHKGLFQINEKLHADKIKGRDLFDPLVNVQVAAAISKESFAAGHDMFRPWEAYTRKTPAYLANRGWGGDAYDYVRLQGEISLGQAQANAIAALVPGGVLIGNTSAAAAVAGKFIGDPVGKVLEFIKESAATIGVFILGLVLLLLGLWVLVGQRSVKEAVKEAGGVIPLGKLGKLTAATS